MVMQAADVLRGRGADIRPIAFPDATVMVERWTDFCGADTAIAHEPYFAENKDKYGPVLTSLIEVGLALSGVEHARIVIERDKFIGALNAVFADVDAIVIPSQPYPTPTNAFMDTLGAEEGSVERLISFTAPHDMARTPAMCLPGGFDEDGMPMGFQIVGPSAQRGAAAAGGPRLPAGYRLAQPHAACGLRRAARWRQAAKSGG